MKITRDDLHWAASQPTMQCRSESGEGEPATRHLLDPAVDMAR